MGVFFNKEEPISSHLAEKSKKKTETGYFFFTVSLKGGHSTRYNVRSKPICLQQAEKIFQAKWLRGQVLDF